MSVQVLAGNLVVSLGVDSGQPQLPEPREVVEEGEDDEGGEIAGDRSPGVSHLRGTVSIQGAGGCPLP